MDVGERMTPHNLFSDAVREEFALTMQRYRFAVEYVQGREVLDSGCGVGNGSLLLSAVARSVVAIDHSQEAIDFALTYYRNTNLTFVRHDLSHVFPQTFDTIVSFDVIEHLASPSAYLSNLFAELKSHGQLIISTPNKSMLQLVYSEPNKYHLHEMDLDEFTALLKEHFTIVTMHGQHVTDRGPAINNDLSTARTFIAICQKP